MHINFKNISLTYSSVLMQLFIFRVANVQSLVFLLNLSDTPEIVFLHKALASKTFSNKHKYTNDFIKKIKYFKYGVGGGGLS